MKVRINAIKVELEDDLFTCYYPNYYAEWLVDFRTLAGKRREKVITFGDGVKKQLGFINDLPTCELINVEESEIIAKKFTREEFDKNCLMSLKKYYMYKRRSFQIPEIKWLKTFLIYVPYQIKHRKNIFSNKTVNLLYEPKSQRYDKLKKYLIIQKNYNERMAIK